MITLKEFLLENSTGTLDQYKALPENYLVISAANVAAWMGEAGRLLKLRTFIASAPPVELTPAQKAEYQALQNAADVVVSYLSAQNVGIDPTPTTDPEEPNQRSSIDGMAQLGVLTEDDTKSLLDRGRPEGYVEPTEQDRIDTLTEIAVDQAVTVANEAADEAAKLAKQQVTGDVMPDRDTVYAALKAGFAAKWPDPLEQEGV